MEVIGEKWSSANDNLIINDLPSFFSPTDEIYGQTFSYWTGRWWQSFYLTDEQRNAQEVFMVPGRITEIDGGSADPYKHRDFTLRQIPILIPVINWFSPGISRRAQEEAKARIDVVSTDSFNITIDGYHIPKEYCHRVGNDCIELQGKLKELYGFVRGRGLVVSDGYWIFIKGLPIGKHKIGTFGTCSSGMTRIDMDYGLTVQ